LLAELDGIEPLSGIVVLAATNRIDLVDPAMLRPGRLGVHVHVPLPDAAARQAILALYLASVEPAALATSVEATAGCSGAQLREFAARAKRNALLRTGYTAAVLVTATDLAAAVQAAASVSTDA
jgi:SpoVK/Ycf46/Vps4 family AAA+-type ATPase